MNIQDITLEEFSIAVIFIGGLIAGVKYLKDTIKEAIEKFLKDQFKDVNTKLTEMQGQIKQLDIQVTKNFLIRYLSDVEREDVIYDAENKRFWEEYDHYTNDLKENSYIKKWVQDLEKAGKLEARPTKEE